MAIASAKICKKCKKRFTGNGAFCENCRKRVKNIHEKSRKSSSARGYEHIWRKARSSYLSDPDNSFCAICGKVADCIDHIVAPKGDMKLFWDVNNWQPCCLKCNTIKAIKEEGGLGHEA